MPGRTKLSANNRKRVRTEWGAGGLDRIFHGPIAAAGRTPL